MKRKLFWVWLVGAIIYLIFYITYLTYPEVIIWLLYGG